MNGKPSVLIGWVTSGVIRAEFVRSLLALQAHKHEKWEFGGTIDQISAYIDENRNLITQEFLDGTVCNWLLMIDIDMAFNPIALDRLYEHTQNGEKVVCGIYNTWIADKGLVPLSYMLNHATDYYTPVELKKPQHIDAGPAGFLLVHRSVFEEVRKKYGNRWFTKLPTKEDGKDYGEDISFCRRVRELGIQILGVPKLEIRHLKIVPI